MVVYHPCVARGSLLKVAEIIRLAKSTDGGSAELSRNPTQFIENLGISVTNDEFEALLDVINGTSNSSYASPPPNAAFDKIASLRARWIAS